MFMSVRPTRNTMNTHKKDRYHAPSFGDIFGECTCGTVDQKKLLKQAGVVHDIKSQQAN